VSAVFGIGVPELLVIAVWWIPLSVVPIVCFWRILARAGFNSWLAVVAVVPFFTPLLLLFVAFAPWPALAERSK
jgi:hypothetical protein